MGPVFFLYNCIPPLLHLHIPKQYEIVKQRKTHTKKTYSERQTIEGKHNNKHKHQASSIKHQASSIKHQGIKHQASSSKQQASSIKHQASSIKHQASKSSICFVTNEHATENEALLTRQISIIFRRASFPKFEILRFSIL